MKTLGFLIIGLIFLYGCHATRFIHEDILYVTRKYCGDFDTLIIGKKETKIITTQHELFIWGNIPLDIPKHTKCYLRYIPETPSGQMATFWVLYFTWDGTDDLFMLRQNYITGEVY
jgi:hypothetical protein